MPGPFRKTPVFRGSLRAAPGAHEGPPQIGPIILIQNPWLDFGSTILLAAVPAEITRHCCLLGKSPAFCRGCVKDGAPKNGSRSEPRHSLLSSDSGKKSS